MLKSVLTVLFLVALLCLHPTTLCAQEDAEGGKDHPLVSRLPGYYIDVYEERDFDACELKVGPGKSENVAGRMYRISYYTKQGVKAASMPEIIGSYENAIKKIGGSVLYKQIPIPGKSMAFATMKLVKDDREIWVRPQLWNSGRGILLIIVETQDMQQQIVANPTDPTFFNQFPGYKLVASEDKGFKTCHFETGPDKSVTVQGHMVEISYYAQQAAQAVSPLAILRNYENAVGKIGGNVMYSRWQSSVTKTTGDSFTNLKLINNGKQTWLQVRPWNSGRGMQLTIVKQGGPAGDSAPKFLFIDDHHIQEMEGVRRVFHQPVKHKGPVLFPEQPWEQVRLHLWSAPVWSEQRSVWQMWYFGSDGSSKGLVPLYAESTDGLAWEKPRLGLVSWNGSSNNNIFDLGFKTRSAKENRIVLLKDDREENSAHRFKGLVRVSGKLRALVSADGLAWKPLDSDPIKSGDEYRLGYDALNNHFIATAKRDDDDGVGRRVTLAASDDFVRWSQPEVILSADETDRENGRRRLEECLEDPDRRHPQYVRPDEFFTDIYNMPVFTYGDMYLGLPTMLHQSGPFAHSTAWNQDGISYPSLVSSRNLRTWDKLNRQPFIPHSRLSDKHNYDFGAIQANGPVRNGDELWFYYHATRFTHLKQEVIERAGLRKSPDEPMGAIYVARLRLDGFASLHAGEKPGVAVTRSIKVTGRHLHVNADASGGELRAEIIDANTGDRLHALDTNVPLKENEICASLKWQESDDLSALIGREVRIEFRLRNAHLYSFWFSD